MSSTLTTTTFTAVINTGESVTQNSVTAPFNFSDNAAVAPLTAGTGAGAAQHAWTNTFTVNTSGTTLNLQALTGGLDGGTRNFSKVKTVKISNNDPTNTLVVGNAGTNPWTGIVSGTTTTITVPPGGFLWLHAPSAAGLPTSGSSLNLLLAAGASTVSCTVTIVGEGT